MKIFLDQGRVGYDLTDEAAALGSTNVLCAVLIAHKNRIPIEEALAIVKEGSSK